MWKFVFREAQRSGDIPANTSSQPGAVKCCKVGDFTLTLGADSATPGERIVVEAKENASYGLTKAQSEMEIAGKNRGASVGVFVFSKKTAPEGMDLLQRQGTVVFAVWDADDPLSDVILKAALMLARALCVRQAKVRSEDSAGFEKLDSAILEFEREAKRLGNIRTFTETIKNNSEKVLGEVRKMAEGVEQQISVLRETVTALKGSFGKAGSL